MSVLILIIISLCVGALCYCIGRFFGNWLGKKQKMRDEVARNGSKHR